MALNKSMIAVILLGTLRVAELKRVNVNIDDMSERQPIIEAQTEMEDTAQPISEVNIDRATGAIAGAEPDAAGVPVFALKSAAALLQETALGVSAPALNFTGRRRWDVNPNATLLPPSINPTRRIRRRRRDPLSIFSKTLDYIGSASDYGQEAILRAACDSFSFSCEEIIQLADSTLVYYTGFLEELFAYQWKRSVMVFAEGRNSEGCISDPANVGSILDVYNSVWPQASNTTDYNVLNAQWRALQIALLENEHLKPAKDVGQPPTQLYTGLRPPADMAKLLGEMTELQLIKAYVAEGVAAWYVPGGAREKEFEGWLKQIRSDGEQFTGSQLVALVRAVPANSPIIRRHYGDQFGPFRVLLQHLEQYVTGVTCEEVNEIIQWMENDFDHNQYQSGFWPEDIEPLKSIVVDAQNKVDIVAFADVVKEAGNVSYMVPSDTERLLRDIGTGGPPKNNPVFGVVKGNPVILVVDESTSMDTDFVLDNDTFTRRDFCKRQLETALRGLPKGTHFNIVQYSSSAVKVFKEPVLANKSSINAAIQAMGTRWTSNHTPEQDPFEMFRQLQAFALKLKHNLNQSIGRNSTEALQLAYATAHLPAQKPSNEAQEIFPGLGGPQIYFLASGQPDAGASQVLDNIHEFDKGRNIPVNGIGFITSTENDTKQFVKGLARSTGGFFRSIEQPSQHKKRKREPSNQ